MLSNKTIRSAAIACLSGLLIAAALWRFGASAGAQTTTIPLGSYTGVLNEAPSPVPYFTPGQYQITFLEGGKFRYEANDRVSTTGTYTLTAEAVEFTVAACAGKIVYQWSLQGNRLTLILAAGQTESCFWRAGMGNTYFRTDQLESYWRRIGPLGGSIYSLFMYEGKLFAGTYAGGIFISEDNGQSWRAARSTKGWTMMTFAAFNGNLFASGEGFVILISQDGGETWEFCEPPDGAGDNYILGFAVFNGRLYGAANGFGVIRATENLRKWEKAGVAGLTNVNVTSLAVVGPNLFAATDGGGVFVSTDGNNWAAVNNGLTLLRIHTLAVSGNTLYAATATGNLATNEVYVTQNNGQSWQRVGNGLASLPTPYSTNRAYQLLPLGGKLYAAHDNGVIVNEGGNWRTLYSWPFLPGCYSIVGSGNQLFAGAWFDGVARSLDGGASWSFANNGLAGRATNAVFKDNGVLYAGVDDGVFTSVNEGQSWTRTTTLGTPTYNFLAFEGKVYAGTAFGVYVTANQGQTWTRVSNGMPGGLVTKVISVGNVLYASHLTGGVFRSPDGGQSWTAVNNGLTNLNALSIVVRGTTLFAGTATAGVFRSTNEGQNWTAVTNGLPAGPIFAMTVSGNNLLAAVRFEAIYRSSDNGDTWVKSANGVVHPGVDAFYTNGNTVYAGGLGGLGVIRSTDNGQTWSFFNAGFDARSVNGFFVSGSTLYAATWNGVYASNALVNAGATVSAASYSPGAITEKAIVAAFGVDLALGTEIASSVPLPTTLAGTTIKVRDSNGVDRPAPLFFVSGGQINYQIPPGTATGIATVTITNGNGVGAINTVEVRASAPSIFTANAGGSGPAAAVDALTGAAAPFNAKRAGGEPNIISVFGTGLGADATDTDANVNSSVTARIDGNPVILWYAGQAPGYIGLNQFNVEFPANITAGTHTLTLTRGAVSNTVTIAIR
ncbi:MAG TPA: hypothetical protein PLD20_05505 [Blastocatellia bacterium]|nr:hypothetical protein [Blastocatellia bacterium]HMY72259.1 hypothetical protein [Blastocatellia bacterium]HMZ17363.1 hypothetical protein [Blastocatellia bacterium]HNG28604.1 hypothetical protein [Blastocatellia bacterium]